MPVAALLGLIAGLVTLTGFANAAGGSERAYTVANFPVQATAKNAVAAKKAAIADGQSAALRSLLKRIVPVTAYGRLRQMGEVNAADYIDGLSVRSEQNSSTEYYASLDFAFQADSVRQLLRQRGVPFIDEQAPAVTLVTVSMGADGQPERSAGPWGEIWKSLDLKNAISPLNVAGLRATIHADVLAGLAQGDAARGMRILSSEYGSDLILVAQAKVDTAANKLNVSVSGRDGVGPMNWSRSYRIYDGDVAYAMELAAVVTLGVIEGRWKAAKARQSGGLQALAQPASQFRVEVLFNSARDWYRLQRELAGLDGVGDFRVEAVSARSADVSLAYPGGGSGLSNALARKGYSLVEAGDRWIMRQRF
ncbi:MAG: DUF2066 domain-containing protein [Alphaproteobacteria bacterium]|nr:DUF2066 domain-containing protein [Alphaproteobacteria bacterium]